MGEVLRAQLEMKAKISRPIYYRAETDPFAMTVGRVTSAIMTAKPGARTLITGWSLLRGTNTSGAGAYAVDDGGGLTLAQLIQTKNEKRHMDNPVNTRILNGAGNGAILLEQYILLKDNEQLQAEITSLAAGTFTYAVTFQGIEFLM